MSGYSSRLKTYASGEIHWVYPQDEEPPLGVKLHILQGGCVSIQGNWDADAGYLAWQRMFKRDHKKEEEYILLMRTKLK